MKLAKKNDDTFESLKFLAEYLDIIKIEKSLIAKMVLQENYIILSMGSVMIASDFVLYGLPRKSIKLNQTLGRMIISFVNASIKKIENKILLKKLNDFKEIRDKITHNIIYKYKNIAELQKDAKEATVFGDEIILILSNLVKQLMDEYIKISVKNTN